MISIIEPFWRLFHGRLSALFCYALYCLIVFLPFIVWHLAQKYEKPDKKVSLNPTAFFCLFIPHILFYYVALYPGIYTYDSLMQYSQADSGRFEDWHPPIMAGVWRVLIHLFEVKESLFFAYYIEVVLSVGLFYYIIYKISEKNSIGLIFTTLVSPCYMIYAGHVWKDVGMAFSLLIAFSLAGLAIIMKINKTIAFLAALPFIIYAITVRSNCLPAVVPLVFIFFSGVEYIRKRFLLGISLTFLVVMLLYLCASITQSRLFQPKSMFIQQALFLHDISYIALHNPDPIKIPDQYSRYRYTLQDLKAAYKPISYEYLVSFHLNPSPPLQLIHSKEAYNDLENKWVETVIKNPMTYLHHRVEVFVELLKQKGGFFTTDSKKMAEGMGLNEFSVPDSMPSSFYLRHIIQRSIRFLCNYTPLMSVGFWFFYLIFLSVLNFVYLKKTSIIRLALALSISGLMYLIPYFIIAAHVEFRYAYWSVISAIFSTALLLCNIINNKKQITSTSLNAKL